MDNDTPLVTAVSNDECLVRKLTLQFVMFKKRIHMLKLLFLFLLLLVHHIYEYYVCFCDISAYSYMTLAWKQVTVTHIKPNLKEL